MNGAILVGWVGNLAAKLSFAASNCAITTNVNALCSVGLEMQKVACRLLKKEAAEASQQRPPQNSSEAKLQKSKLGGVTGLVSAMGELAATASLAAATCVPTPPSPWPAMTGFWFLALGVSGTGMGVHARVWGVVTSGFTVKSSV